MTEVAIAATGIISTQVLQLQEFFVTTTAKLGVDPLAAKAILETFAVFEIVQASPRLIEDAIDCSIVNRLAFWDALIITAAAPVVKPVGVTTVPRHRDINDLSGRTLRG